MNRAEHSISLSFRSNQKYTEMAILVLNYLKNILALDDENFFKVEMSLREAVTNAIIHGNQLDPSKRVHVSFLWKNSRLRLEVQDENHETTDFSKIQDKINACELLSVNGRGITIMRSYMDSFEFVCTGTGNRVVLEKSLK